MWEFMSVARALGDENRVRALLALRGRELCLCQIIELLGLAQSTVSKHMSILRQARLVRTRKTGRWVFYRLTGKGASREVHGALDWLQESLATHPSALQDEHRIQEILKMELTALCSMQGGRLAECPSTQENGRAEESERRKQTVAT